MTGEGGTFFAHPFTGLRSISTDIEPSFCGIRHKKSTGVRPLPDLHIESPITEFFLAKGTTFFPPAQ
jgi:hypothetical protein